MQTVSWQRNLVMLWFSQLMVMSGYDALNPFIPLFLKESLGVTSAAELAYFVSWYSAAGFIGYGISNPLWGWLGDKYGMKPMLIRGTFLTSVFWIWMAYVSSPWMLVFLRFVTAFLAGTTAASQIMLARTTPTERQGFALGVLLSAIWAGSVLGNVAGGFMIHYFNYTWAFWSCGLMYIAAGVFTLFTNDIGSSAQPVQKVSKGIHLPSLSSATWVVIALFVVMGLMRRIDLSYTSLRVEMLVSKGTAAYWTGIVSSCVGGGAILSGVLLGKFVDKYPARKLLLPVIVGTVVFSMTQAYGHSLWFFCGSRVLVFFIVGILAPMLQKLLSEVTVKDKRGLAFGLSSTGNAIGGCVASALSGFLMGHYGVCSVFVGTAVVTLLMWPVLHKGIAWVERGMQKKAIEEAK